MKRRIRVKLDFYEIINFGYTKRNEKAPQFGGCADILSNLKHWLEGKKIRQTKTFQFKNKSDSNLLGVFCPSLLNNAARRSFFMTIWNEIPNEDGAVASLNGENPVGQYSVDNTSVPEGNIPGFGTFFWFLPEQMLYVTIRINESLHIGREAMVKYILGFMKNNSSYVRLIEEEDGEEVSSKVRYAKDQDSDAQYLIPQFLSRPARNKTQIEKLRSCCNSIRKGIKKEQIGLRLPANRGFVTALLHRLGVNSSIKRSDKLVKYRYEFDFEPTIKELNQIIKNHKRILNSYDDVGFQLTGSNETIWLSSVLCKAEDTLEINYSDDGKTLDSQSFYNAIEQQREKYLAEVRNSRPGAVT